MNSTDPPAEDAPGTLRDRLGRRARNTWSGLRFSARQTVNAWVNAARSPGRERDLAAQALKSALAALLAWGLASWLFTDSLSLLAPWVAVVMVQATVFQSLSQGARQTVAIVLGTAMATGTALLLDSQLLALVLVLPVALLMGSLERFGSQGVAVATSAIFALTGGPATPQVSVERVASAVIGAVLGIAVNALVRPPRYLRDARSAVLDATDEIAGVLREVASTMERGDWADAPRVARRAQYLHRRVSAVRSAVDWDQESLRLNMRRRSTERLLPSGYTGADLVHTVGKLADNTRGLALVTEESTERTADQPALPDWLIETYGRCLTDTASAVEAYGRVVTGDSAADATELTEGARRALAGLERLSDRIDLTALPDVGAMTLIGPLLSDTRHIALAVRPSGADR